MAITRNFETADVESLLTREGRACLPLGRQVLLYLDPFALFMDASRGPAWKRERALCYNRARRPMLLTYIKRWILIAAGSFLGIAFAEALGARSGVFIIPAVGFGIGCSVAVTISACASAAYLLLGLQPKERQRTRA